MKSADSHPSSEPFTFRRLGHFLCSSFSDFYARNTSEFWLMCGIGAFTLSVYLLTLAPGVVPGLSAVAAGSVLRLLPGIPVTHPLWLTTSRAVAALPVFDTVFRLNLFSAVCGSIAAAWLFRLTKRVIFEMIRESPTLRLVPVAEDEPTGRAPLALAGDPAQRALPDEDSDATEYLIANLGGVVTVLSFAFSAPFWIASVSLHAQTFNLLLLLLTFELLACYRFTGKTSACVAAVFLLSLGAVESVAFIVLAPLILAVILLTSIRYNQLSESLLLLLLLTGLSGLALNLGLFILLSDWGPAFDFHLVPRLLSGLARSHVTALLYGLPRTGWLIVCFQTVAPLLLAAVSIRKFSAQQDESTRWKWGVTNVLFTAFSVACLTNLPHTAWSMAREGSSLPVFPSLAVACAVGCCFVYWCLMASRSTYNASFDLGTPSLGLRILGYGMCGLLGIVTLRSFHMNVDDSNGRKTAFADRLADEVLRQAGPARCLVTDGTLDLNVIIRAHVTNKKITVLPCSRSHVTAPRETSQKAAPFRLVLSGSTAPQNASPEAFVEGWLREHPREHAQVAVLGTPALWQRAGFVPVPAGLVYVGMPQKGALDCTGLLTRQTELCRRLAPLLADDPSLRPELRRLQSRLRAYASRMANDLGVLLERSDHAQEADSAYTESLRLDEKNLCACLNQYGLRLRAPELGPTLELASRLQSLSAEDNGVDAFDRTVARFGALAPQAADSLLPAVLAGYGSGTKPPPNVLRLWEKWLGESGVAPGRRPSPLMRPKDVTAAETPDLKLSNAIALLLADRSAEAEKQLRLIVRNQPAHLSAWSLLAELLMNREAFAEIRETVLPAMRAAVGSTAHAHTLIEMTQGCLFMRATPPNAAEARACFARALEHDPKLPSANEELLRADLLLGDAACLEKDALLILSHLPDFAAANAILGSRRLAQKRYAEAESCLRKSIVSQPTCGALNDLAELLRQQGKRTEAEQQARLAIRLKPDFYQAWDTLGNILLEDGRLDEANGPLRCAIALGSNDPRLYLTLTRLRIKQGRLQDASQVLAYSKPLLGHASTSILKEHEQLKQQLFTQSKPN